MTGSGRVRLGLKFPLKRTYAALEPRRKLRVNVTADSAKLAKVSCLATSMEVHKLFLEDCSHWKVCTRLRTLMVVFLFVFFGGDHLFLASQSPSMNPKKCLFPEGLGK